jgi:hypothetical protein
MVEDDDEQYTFEDDYDNRSDNYGYDAASRRNTSNTSRSASSGGLDKNKLVEYQSQVGLLQEKVDDLEGQLRMKDEQVNKLQGAERDKSAVCILSLLLKELYANFSVRQHRKEEVARFAERS